MMWTLSEIDASSYTTSTDVTLSLIPNRQVTGVLGSGQEDSASTFDWFTQERSDSSETARSLDTAFKLRPESRYKRTAPARKSGG